MFKAKQDFAKYNEHFSTMIEDRTYWDLGAIKLAVQDTGSGIPDDIMKKLGTPFVTTKNNGTGLGLPVCFRIAETHRAKINIETGPQGTTFTVIFSALDEDVRIDWS